jgi:hypothetical protein
LARFPGEVYPGHNRHLNINDDDDDDDIDDNDDDDIDDGDVCPDSLGRFTQP